MRSGLDISEILGSSLGQNTGYSKQALPLFSRYIISIRSQVFPSKFFPTIQSSLTLQFHAI
jgi:hypothetical protein